VRKITECQVESKRNGRWNPILTFENAVSLSVFLFFLSVYVKTMCPTVFWWDSGEFIANVAVLGIPHRPGFPIFVLLGRLFSFLPFWNVAFKVNSLSALCASVSLGICCKAFFEVVNIFFPAAAKRREVVALSVLSFLSVLGFTYSFWIQAVRAEVYALNMLFFSVLLYVSILWVKNEEPKHIYLFFFILGLGLGNHHLSLLSTIPAFIFLFLTSVRRSFIELKRIPLYALLFLAGMSVYLYIPIRSLCNPPLVWGAVKSLSSSANSIFALDTIKNLNFAFLSNLTDKTTELLSLFFDQLTPLCFALSLVGLVLLLRHSRRILTLLLLMIIGNCAVVIFMTTEFISTNPDLHGYLIFSIFSLAFFYGLGVLILLNFTRHSSSFVRHSLLIVFGVISLFPLLKHYPEADISNNRIAHHYGTSVISDLDSNSVLIVDNVNLNFILRELRYAERKREDVTVIDRGLLGFDWYVNQERQEQGRIFGGISEGLRGDRLFAAIVRRCQDLDKPTYVEFTERDSGLVDYLIPRGYVFQVSRTSVGRLSEKDLVCQKEWDADSPLDKAISESDLTSPQDKSFRRDWDAQRVYALSFYRSGLFYEWKGMIAYALRQFEKVNRIDPQDEELMLRIRKLQAFGALSRVSCYNPVSAQRRPQTQN
jgi:hypothetical protein